MRGARLLLLLRGRLLARAIPEIRLQMPHELDLVAFARCRRAGDRAGAAGASSMTNAQIKLFGAIACSVIAMILAVIVITGSKYSADDKKAAWAAFSGVSSFWLGTTAGG
jgi:hypothetical protein